MDTLKIKGKPEDAIFELKSWISFLERHYDIQDEEIKKEFDISIKDMKEKLEILEGI